MELKAGTAQPTGCRNQVVGLTLRMSCAPASHSERHSGAPLAAHEDCAPASGATPVAPEHPRRLVIPACTRVFATHAAGQTYAGASVPCASWIASGNAHRASVKPLSQRAAQLPSLFAIAGLIASLQPTCGDDGDSGAVLLPRETVLHAEMSHTHNRDRAPMSALGVVVLGTGTQRFGARRLPYRVHRLPGARAAIQAIL
jgi:hypothetical protein